MMGIPIELLKNTDERKCDEWILDSVLTEFMNKKPVNVVSLMEMRGSIHVREKYTIGSNGYRSVRMTCTQRFINRKATTVAKIYFIHQFHMIRYKINVVLKIMDSAPTLTCAVIFHFQKNRPRVNKNWFQRKKFSKANKFRETVTLQKNVMQDTQIK